ncbi:MAG: PQQ-binding-like beta-propeller repeat protein [Croceibacterium sp.]
MHFVKRTGLPLLLLGGLAACSTLGLKKDKPETPTLGNRMPILSRISSALTADPTLAGITVVLPPPVTNEEWPQAGGNPSKSIGHLSLATAPTRAWQVSIPGDRKARRLAAAPVVGGGSLFVVDTEGSIRAYDAATGGARWVHPLVVTKDLRPSLFGGGVSYFDGKLYATSGAGDVVALNAADGAELWRAKPGGPLRGPPTVAFNAVYVMSQDNQIFSLGLADGKLAWQEAGASGTQGVFGVGAPAAGQGTVIAGYSSGELVAYRYENGRNLWSDALSRTSISTSVGTLTDVDADPIIDNGRVYAIGQGGRIAAYELVTGQRIWEQSLAGISTPAVAGEWLFTLTDDARLLAIAKATGKIRWVTQLSRWTKPKGKTGPIFWTGPVLANNRLWVASSRGELQSVDVTTGDATPFTKLDSGISQAPLIANNTLYILQDNGKLSAWR